VTSDGWRPVLLLCLLGTAIAYLRKKVPLGPPLASRAHLATGPHTEDEKRSGLAR